MTALAPVRFSELKQMARSPAHYRDAADTPRTATPPTAAMLRGSLIHAMILGGDVAVYPGERRGNAWTAFKEANSSRLIVTEKEHDAALPIAEAVRRHPIAPGLLEGEHEIELEWEWCGRACAGRLDVLGDGRVVDLKTAASASPGWFRFDALKRLYHCQLFWYLEGARQNRSGIDYAFAVAVETKRPYPVTPFKFTERALEEGERICRLWMEQLRVCEDSGTWPEYASCIVELDIPEADPDLVFGDEDGDENESEAA